MAWEPDYVTTAELRAYITRSSVTVDDTQLAWAATAASRDIDHYCARQFGKVAAAEARIFTAEFDRQRQLWMIDLIGAELHSDIHSVTGLEIMVDDDDDQVYDQEVDSYRLWPYTPGPGRPWTRVIIKADSAVKPTCREGAVEVTANYGWAAVPSPVVQATLIQANRIFQRRVSPYGIAGSPETGSELRLLRDVDVDVQRILASYRYQWGAV